jgi:DeoR/GlpR family transcriptional regulator of sugar metabolism
MKLIAGRWAREFLSGLKVDIAFISSAGITLEQGLTTSRRPLEDVVNAARAVARRTAALIDSTKFGRASLLTMVRPQDLDLLVVDSGLPPDAVERYRRAGVAIEQAAAIPQATI